MIVLDLHICKSNFKLLKVNLACFIGLPTSHLLGRNSIVSLHVEHWLVCESIYNSESIDTSQHPLIRFNGLNNGIEVWDIFKGLIEQVLLNL